MLEAASPRCPSRAARPVIRGGGWSRVSGLDRCGAVAPAATLHGVFPSTTLRPLSTPARAVLIAAATCFVIAIPAAFGVLSLPGIAVLATLTLVAAVGILLRVPQALVVLVPACLPSPMMAYTYTWEVLLFILAALVFLDGWRRRLTDVHTLSELECWLLVFTAWCLVSALWSPDLRTYLIGARRVLLGFATCWLALRLPRVATRGWFDAGLVGAAISLSLAALVRQVSSGMSGAEALLRRPEATNLGWGTANFIATLLLLLIPPLLAMGLQGRVASRLGGWAGALIAATVQMMIASRAAVILFFAGTLAQVTHRRGKRRGWTVVAVIAVLSALIASPMGSGLYERFTSLREFGSMTIRIWYVREGWRRMVEHFPFGMGLGQGYANADKLQGIDPHNFWLVVGGDHGLPGLVLWAGVLVLLWRATGRLLRTPEWVERGRALRIAMALAHLHTLVEPTFQGTQYPFVFLWLVCGSLAYHDAEAAASSRR